MKTASRSFLALIAAAAAVSFGSAAACFAQSDAPYTEGHVWTITMVKTKVGLGDQYLTELGKFVNAENEALKKAGVILDAKILIGESSNAQDFDVMILTEYKDMAAFDTMREKSDPIIKKIEGSLDKQAEIYTKRLEIRDFIGSKTMREITLK